MTTQNYQNHRQSDRGWLTAFLILFVITILALRGAGLDIVYYIQEGIMEDALSYAANIFLTFAPLLFAWIVLFKLRGYATKLQDRIIRQEVNFRYYMITGKTLDPALTTKQIVALRFAGDDEFVALCAKAVQEGLSNKEIKQLITERGLRESIIYVSFDTYVYISLFEAVSEDAYCSAHTGYYQSSIFFIGSASIPLVDG